MLQKAFAVLLTVVAVASGWFAPIAAVESGSTSGVVASEGPTYTGPTYTGPTYTKDGGLMPPVNYREWIYLSSGIDMSYGPGAGMQGHSMFDNVFVNQAAYKRFLDDGTWPDKTVMVLEVRGAETKGSINHNGHYQSQQLMGMEVHVKDEARFPGKWAFFDFAGDGPGKLIPQRADCYSCHAEHAAVDTTFVQFYPTLLGIAQKKGTLSASYLKEIQGRGERK